MKVKLEDDNSEKDRDGLESAHAAALPPKGRRLAEEREGKAGVFIN